MAFSLHCLWYMNVILCALWLTIINVAIESKSDHLPALDRVASFLLKFKHSLVRLEKKFHVLFNACELCVGESMKSLQLCQMPTLIRCFCIGITSRNHLVASSDWRTWKRRRSQSFSQWKVRRTPCNWPTSNLACFCCHWMAIQCKQMRCQREQMPYKSPNYRCLLCARLFCAA